MWVSERAVNGEMVWARRVLVLLTLGVLLVRCGGGRGPAAEAHFFLSIRNPSISVVQGGQATLTMSIERIGNFTAPVQMSIESLPEGVEASFSPNPVLTEQTSVTLTLLASLQTPTGSYTVTIRAQGGSISREAQVQLTIGTATPDFNIQLSLSSVSIVRGGSASLQVSLTRIGNFQEAVSLSLEGAPTGVSAEFIPPTLSGQQSLSTLTLRVSTSAATGTFTLTVVATSGSIRRTAQLNLTVVVAPDFTLSLSSSDITLTRGGQTTLTVTLTRIGGFAQPVVLSISGLPAGVTASFNPSTIPGNQNSAALTLQVSASASPGVSTLTVRGTGGGLTRSTNLTLRITETPDFSLSVEPSSLVVQQGGSVSATVRITRIGGFNEAVALSATNLPQGVSASFNPSSIRPGEESQLTLQVGTQVPHGNYALTVQGTAGSLSRMASLSLQVLVSFQHSIQPIFTQRCAMRGCHDSQARTADLDLSAGNAYANIVNVRSVQDPNWIRVVSGDPMRSLLYRKVSEDNPPVGSRMPLGGRLSDEQIMLIRLWIEQGARNN